MKSTSTEEAEMFAKLSSTNFMLNPLADYLLPSIVFVLYAMYEVPFKFKQIKNILQKVGSENSSALDGIPVVLLYICSP